MYNWYRYSFYKWIWLEIICNRWQHYWFTMNFIYTFCSSSPSPSISSNKWRKRNWSMKKNTKLDYNCTRIVKSKYDESLNASNLLCWVANKNYIRTNTYTHSHTVVVSLSQCTQTCIWSGIFDIWIGCAACVLVVWMWECVSEYNVKWNCRDPGLAMQFLHLFIHSSRIRIRRSILSKQRLFCKTISAKRIER